MFTVLDECLDVGGEERVLDNPFFVGLVKFVLPMGEVSEEEGGGSYEVVWGERMYDPAILLVLDDFLGGGDSVEDGNCAYVSPFAYGIRVAIVDRSRYKDVYELPNGIHSCAGDEFLLEGEVGVLLGEGFGEGTYLFGDSVAC